MLNGKQNIITLLDCNKVGTGILTNLALDTLNDIINNTETIQHHFFLKTGTTGTIKKNKRVPELMGFPVPAQIIFYFFFKITLSNSAGEAHCGLLGKTLFL